MSDPEATARMFVHSLVHHLIVQEMLHGKDIMPIERDLLVENLVKSDRLRTQQKILFFVRAKPTQKFLLSCIFFYAT